jgi:hypothetical protein
LTGHVSKLRDKAKLVLATISAVTATTMAVITFASGGGGMDELAAADAIQWNGPVGLLDADYAHLVTVGKIESSSTQDEYAASEVRDPMVAPSGVLKAKSKPQDDGKDKAPAPVTLPNMWLSGIIWDPETPIVIIDGMDLRVGDRIKGARVVEIRMDSVVLSFASKHFTLTVE